MTGVLGSKSSRVHYCRLVLTQARVFYGFIAQWKVTRLHKPLQEFSLSRQRLGGATEC